MTPDDRTRAIPPVPPDPSTIGRRPTVADTLARSTSEDTGGFELDPPAPDLTRSRDPEQTAAAPDFRAADAPPAADPPLAPFAQFKPIDELGRGGMGVVYRALDTDFMRDVAVKVLSERLVGNRTAVRRFLEEARVTGQLTHTAIPAVHQMGTLPDGRPFLAMKLIKGKTLGEMLKARRDPAADLTHFLDILEKVCEGVGYAHAKRVMHRDLKPGNVMVGTFGEVQVMDWGLAREVRGAEPASRERDGPGEDDAPVAPAPGSPADGTVLREVRFPDEEYTRAGTVLGTPAYMAPEQAAADPDAIDVRADVFGLGAILCAILTGHPPYTGQDVNEVVLKALRWDTADAFRRLNHSPGRSELGVIALCKRCLAKNPADRPADGGAVAKELAELRASTADRLKRADLKRMAEIAKGQELKKRVWWQVGLVSSAALVISGLLGFGWWYSDRLTKEQTRLSKKAEDAVREKAEAERDAQLQKEEEGRVAKLQKEQTAQAARQKQAQLEEAFKSDLDEVKRALMDVPAAGGDAALWDAALGRARAAQLRASDRFKELKDPALASQVSDTEARVKRAEDDRRLTTTLDAIASVFLEREQIADRNPAIADRYREALASAGLKANDPKEFARRVREHPVPAALIEAVFDWHANAADLDRPQLATLLDAITAGTPFLSKWWAAAKVTGPDGTKKLLELASTPDAPAESGWVIHRMFCDLWNRGERDAALRVIRAGLLWKRGDYRLHARLALNVWTLDTPAARREAIRHATAAVALRPKSVNAYILLGRLEAEETGDPAAALPHLNAAFAADPTSVPALTERAAVLLRLGNTDQANRDYERINQLDPTAVSRLRLVESRWAKGEKGEAVAELKDQLIPNVPKTAAAQLELAKTCRALGLTAEAEAAHREVEAAYRQVVEAAPQSSAPRVEFARYLIERASAGPEADRRKRLEEAEGLLLKAAADPQKSATPHLLLTRVYARLKDDAKALASAKKVVELGQQAWPAELVLAAAQREVGEYAAAAATAGRYAEAAKDDHRGPYLLAEIAAAQGKWGEAARHAEKAVERNDKAATVWNQLALYRGYSLDRRGAIAALQKAIELEPNVPLYHYNISGWYLSVGELTKFAEHQEKCRQLNPAYKNLKPIGPTPPKK